MILKSIKGKAIAVVCFAGKTFFTILQTIAAPSAPGSFAGCEVVSYSTEKIAAMPQAKASATPKTRLLSASPATETVEKWVVRSTANSNVTYAVRRTLSASSSSMLCAYTPNKVLVTLAEGQDYAVFEQQMANKGYEVLYELMRDADNNPVYVVRAINTEDDVAEAMTQSIQATGLCGDVMLNYLYELESEPNDPRYGDQWGLSKIDAPTAWNTRTDASSVIVAVLDTGVCYNHIDLAQNMWMNPNEIPGDGIDNDGNGIVDDIHGMASTEGNVSNDSNDYIGHGSHVAGIIGAGGNNGAFVSGVAWNAKIMGLRFITGTMTSNFGTTEDAVRCLKYAEEQGAKIINCSIRLLNQGEDWCLKKQMKRMSDAGIIFVCAACNAPSGSSPVNIDDYPVYPACTEIDLKVVVAATDQNDDLANFSFYGPKTVDIAAPGVDIYSTLNDSRSCGYLSGTSMATPHVAGALALLMAEYPDDTPRQIIDRLYAAAEPIAALNGKVRTASRLSMTKFFGLAAPASISVSQGSVSDAVVIYWTAVDNATHYRVWRSETENGDKIMLCDWRQGLTYMDSDITPGVTNWYFLQAASSDDGLKASSYSVGIPGYRPAIDTSRVTVTFDPVGGAVNPVTKVYRVGETYADLPSPTYSGNAFLGWFTAAQGGTRLDTISLVRAEATTLYAHWIGASVLRVENLFARQRYPWNGYVDVTFDLFGVPESEYASVALTASEEDGSNPLALRTFVSFGPTNLLNGSHHVVWNATPDTQAKLYENIVLSAGVSIDVPSAPLSGTAIDNPIANGIDLTWTAAHGATSYTIWRGTADNLAAATPLATSSGTAYMDTTGEPGTFYHFWIKSVSSGGTSADALHLSERRGLIPMELAISGVSSMSAGGTASFVCTATLNDGSHPAVTPTWSIVGGSDYAESIDNSGMLSARETATSGNVTIQAEYTLNNVTVRTTKTVAVNTVTVMITFDGNNGTSSQASKSYTSYGAYGTMATATRDGYTFAGWWTAASGGSQVTISSRVPATATTLYAHWTANTYSIRFNANGGTGTMPDLDMTYDEAKNLTSNNFEKANCVFAGWATSSGGNVAYTNGQRINNLTSTQGFMVNLYAVWDMENVVPALKVDSGKSTAGAMLSWNEIPSAQYYMVYKNSSDNPSGATLLSVTSATNYMDSYSGSVAGTTYYYWVRSITGSGATTNEYSTSAPGYGLLADPKNVAASKGTYSSYVRVTWSAVSGATSYRVYRNTIPVWNSAMQIGTTTSTSYSDASASSGVQYYYWVQGACSTCMSPMGAYDTGYVGTLAAAEEPVHATKGALYKVIDLSGGTGATSYPVYYLNAMPENGWTEEFKTKKLVMRRVEAGTFMMGSPESELGRYADETQHQVTLTEPFYIGVFPVTTEQWRLVCTNVPSSFSTIASMPADNISYSMIRGNTEGAKWPQANSVNDASFLGSLRMKTGGMVFDLPTEAQWEYACRAGTQTAFNADGITSVNADTVLDGLGRYAHNGGAIANPGGYLQSGFNVNVGQYTPNNWGIYDMHGNVMEWCRDWYSRFSSESSVIDPVGGSSSSGYSVSFNSGRVRRGGCASFDACKCRSAYRDYPCSPGINAGACGDCGFRLVCPVDLETLGEALDSPDLNFTTGGSAEWKVATDETHFGGSSAKSGTITHSQSTWMQTEVSGCGTLSFWYKVSSESSFDKLTFYIDGIQKTTVSGTGSGWSQLSYDVTNNTQHVLKWTYSKDSSVSSGDDCVWIDKVIWETTATVTVTLDQQGGDGGTAIVTATYGSAMPTITPPVRAGYTFGGYYTSTGGTGTQYYTVSGTSAHIWDKISATTLYAKWTANSSFGLVLDDALGNYAAFDAWPCALFLGVTNTLDSAEAKSFTPGSNVYIHFAWQNIGLNIVSNPTVKLEVLTATMSLVATASATSNIELESGYATYITGWTWGTIRGLSHGSYILRLTLDPDCLIEDVDREDNVLTYAFNVDATGLEYDVIFDQQGGSGGTTSIAAVYGSAMPTITVPTRTGYTFGGYYTAASGSGTQYYSSSGASTRAWDKTSDTTLYAKWTANSYVLSVNPNGGTLVGSNFGAVEGTSQQTSVNVTYDALYYYELGTATRSGYTFDGWWTSATGGEKVYDANGLAVTGSRYWNTSWQWQYPGGLTVYAHWTSVSNTVTLNMQSGSGGTSSVTATYGSAMPSITVPTRTGYTFGGYYTSTGGSGTQYYTASGASVRTWDKTSDTSLYAKWTASTCTVTLNMQSGSGGTSSVTATYGSAMPSITVPTRSGYTFGGYYTGTNGSGTQYYTASGTSARTWDKTSATTLYAKWTVPSYEVTLNKQNGTGGSSVVYATYGSAMPSISIPTRSGYTFGGYYTSTGGSGTQYYTATGASARNWDKTSSITLYAKWIAAQYVVIDLSNGSSASSYPVSYLDAVPSGGWNDTYKTSKLVLRLIPAGTFTMGTRSTDYPGATDGSLYNVTISKAFYMGVFEVTQRQWELVMGTRPSLYYNDSYYSTRPVEHVTYEMVRGLSYGSQWPSSSAVDSTSFIGKIRSRTGLTAIDLPTKAEWEYACRAGTTTALNSGKNLTSEFGSCANLSAVARNWYNQAQQNGRDVTTASGTNKVGSYTPNSWGLYDMHGNVSEWCLDWSGAYSSSSVTDPKGPSSGSYRVAKGGDCGSSPYYCRSGYQSLLQPGNSNNAIGVGLRLAIR